MPAYFRTMQSFVHNGYTVYVFTYFRMKQMKQTKQCKKLKILLTDFNL